MYEQRFGPQMVPILVQKCAEYIREHGLNEEGIFRLPGQDNAVKQFRDAFDAGERPSFPRSYLCYSSIGIHFPYQSGVPEPIAVDFGREAGCTLDWLAASPWAHLVK